MKNINLHYYRQELELSRIIIIIAGQGLAMIILLLLVIVIIMHNYILVQKQTFRNQYLSNFYQQLNNSKQEYITHNVDIINNIINNNEAMLNILNTISDIKTNSIIINKLQLDQTRVVIEGQELLSTASSSFVIALQKTKIFNNVILTAINNKDFVINIEKKSIQ